MLQLKDIRLQRGEKVLLEHANLLIKANQRVGIVGKNGCGKSSLFALLRGELEAEAGMVELAGGQRIGFLAQEIPATDQLAIDYVLDGDQRLCALEAEIGKAEAAQDGMALSRLHEVMYAIGGYEANARAAGLLHGLGFSKAEQSQPLRSFSGGWRMRLNLARILFSNFDLLLLDEPTNHLDLDALVWLEKWFKNYQGTLLLISHDRDFLDGVVNVIAHIEHHSIKIYTGDYSSFEEQRAMQLALQQATYEKQKKQRAHLQQYVDRFRYKASKAKQAQSRVRALEKMALISAAHVDTQFEFHFPAPDRLPSPLLHMKKVSVGYEDKTILQAIDLSLLPGSRIGVIGSNGAGKSTLINLIAGSLTASAGDFELGRGVKIGYFAQHQMDHLNLNQSPWQHLQNLDRKLTEQQGRNYLGQFQFHGDRVFETIENFSGGEKARLALALLVYQKPNLLLLDEPTNHFDLEMRYALSLALQEFEGALIIISHDRHLIRTCTDTLLLVSDGTVREFGGSIDDYPEKAAVSAMSQVETNEKSDVRKQKRQAAARVREQEKPLRDRLKRIEKQLNELQLLLKATEADLGNTNFYTDEKKEALKELIFIQANTIKEIEALEYEWVSLQEHLEK